MNDKELTYEKALERLLISCEQAYSEFGSLNDSWITYKGYTIFKDDYDDIKLLEESIEKAKRYDLLAKEEN